MVDTRFTSLAAPGRFESVGKALKSLRIVGGEGDSATAVGARQARSLQDWEAQYGMTAEEWLERYGGPGGGPDARPALPRGRSGDLRRRRPAGREGPPQAAPLPPQAPRAPPAPAPPQQPRAQRVRAAEGPGGGSWDDGADEWAPPPRRPAFGDVLQRDGRELQYDELRGAPPSKRRGDALRGEDAF